MRHRLPWWVLALLFVVLPIVEIYLLIQLGQVVGPWWTILILIADGVFGAWLMKREGRRAWVALQEALRAGRMPSKELADGALILVGGTLLLTPGFVSDVAGLFCILPFTRPVARRGLTRVIARRLMVMGPGRPFPPPAGHDPGRDWPADGPGARRDPGREDVVRGEVVDDG